MGFGFSDHFVELTMTTEVSLASQTCAALEEAGIPVMLEHRDIEEGSAHYSGFRLLVPMDYSQSARGVANAASAAFYQAGSSAY